MMLCVMHMLGYAIHTAIKKSARRRGEQKRAVRCQGPMLMGSNRYNT